MDKALAGLAEALASRRSSCASSSRPRSTASARLTIGRSLPVLPSAAWPVAAHDFRLVDVARNLAGPIRALRRAPPASAGAIWEPHRCQTGDELQALAEQFNDMAGQLQDSYANLEGRSRSARASWRTR